MTETKRYRCIGGPFAGSHVAAATDKDHVLAKPEVTAKWNDTAALTFTKAAKIARYDLHETADGICVALFKGYR